MHMMQPLKCRTSCKRVKCTRHMSAVVAVAVFSFSFSSTKVKIFAEHNSNPFGDQPGVTLVRGKGQRSWGSEGRDERQSHAARIRRSGTWFRQSPDHSDLLPHRLRMHSGALGGGVERGRGGNGVAWGQDEVPLPHARKIRTHWKAERQ